MSTREEYATELATNLKADFEKNGYDWELNENRDGYVRRILLYSDSRGRYIGEAVITDAKHYGFVPSADDEGNTHEGADDLYYTDTWDEAVEYLNTLAPAGFFFEQDGDFFAVETRDFPEGTGCEPMPAFWSSYLINGDSSGMEDWEVKACDAYLTASNILRVEDAPGEGYFSSSFNLYGGKESGGDLLDYIVRYAEEA